MLLECRRSSSNSRNEKPLIWQAIGSIQALSRFRIRVFLIISLLITLDFNFESYVKLISILILVFCCLRVQKFLLNLLVDFSTNLDPNYVTFNYMDFSLIYLSKNIKIPNFHLN